MELEKKIAIIVVNYQTPWHLNECLTSVYENTDTSLFKLFVVHNNPDEESILTTNRFELKHPGTIEVIQNEKNLGFVEGVNSAYEKAKMYYRVCFLNSDTIVTPEWLRTLNAVLDVHPNVVQVAPDFNHYYDEGTVARMAKKVSFKLGESFGNSVSKFLLRNNQVKSTEKGFQVSNIFYQFCSGACNLARMEPFLERGFFFDPNIVHGYGDDFDTTYFLRQYGDIGVTNDAYVMHFLNVSVNKLKDERATLKDKIKTLNMCYLASKWEERLTKEIEGKEYSEILDLSEISPEIKYLLEFKGICSLDKGFKEYINSIPARELWAKLIG
jgi:GT2 family glycosyltransferase